ncbi:MAG: methyltransferase domain-containing protein [Longimicrobiales bacterium]
MIPRRPPRIADGQEYIDLQADDTELAASLDHVAAVNRWLGGTRALLRVLDPLLPVSGPVSFLDVGTGSADIPRALAAWCTARGRHFRVVAADRQPQTAALAHHLTRPFPNIFVLRADVLRLPFRDHAFDFALFSLTLHHLDDDVQPLALRELARVARRAVIVSELERSWPNYFGAALLAATVWRRNRLTRHDAPLSVRRAFTSAELLAIAREAGFADATVHQNFFERLVLVLDHAPGGTIFRPGQPLVT